MTKPKMRWYCVQYRKVIRTIGDNAEAEPNIRGMLCFAENPKKALEVVEHKAGAFVLIDIHRV